MMARVATMLLLVISTAVAAAPLLIHADPQATDADQQLQPPSWEHPFGTDYLGRDVLARVLYGGQRTLSTALLAALLAVSSGLCAALIAEVAGLQRLMAALINATLALPSLLLALVIASLLDQHAFSLILAVGLAQMPAFARSSLSFFALFRAAAYVDAAHALGASAGHILWVHLVRSARPLLLTTAGTVFGYCLLNSAALSVLGITYEPGVADWGIMLADGRSAFRAAPWVALAPGLAITLVILCVNTLIDAFNARQPTINL